MDDGTLQRTVEPTSPRRTSSGQRSRSPVPSLRTKTTRKTSANGRLLRAAREVSGTSSTSNSFLVSVGDQSWRMSGRVSLELARRRVRAKAGFDETSYV